MHVIQLPTDNNSGEQDQVIPLGAPEGHPFVKDHARWFRTSQMVDAARDAALDVVRYANNDDNARARLVAQYATLRERALRLVCDELVDEGTLMTAEPSTVTTIGDVYVALAALARWIDAVQFTPGHLVKLQVEHANGAMLLQQVDALSKQANEMTKRAGDSDGGAGTYL